MYEILFHCLCSFRKRTQAGEPLKGHVNLWWMVMRSVSPLPKCLVKETARNNKCATTGNNYLCFRVNIGKGKYHILNVCVCVCRRQELHALKLLQREEQREHAQLEQKLQQQREQMFRHIEQEMTVSHMHHSPLVSVSILR